MNIRSLISCIVVLLLVLGYGASQFAAFSGSAPEYAAKVDQAPIQWLALLILIVSVVFAFIPDKEAEDK
jgi:uncharacterized membrane protein YdjX (TVP38/TMEM64 family)